MLALIKASSRALRWLAAAALVLAFAGCDRGGEASRTLLAAHVTAGRRSLAALKTQEIALRDRFEHSTNAAFLPTSQSAVTQVRAALDGARQSLADVDLQLRQASGRFDRAVADGVPPDEAAEQEGKRIDGYLVVMTDALSGAGQALDGFQQSLTTRTNR